MNSRSWLILIAFVLTSSGSTYWYACEIKGLCSDNKTTEVEKIDKPAIQNFGPIDFLWSQADPKHGKDWNSFKNQIVSDAKEGKILNIVGTYYSREENKTTSPNLGIARAEAIRSLFVDKLGADNIQIQSRMLSEGKEISKKETIPMGEYITWVTNNEFVKEIDGKAIVYFPSNSDKEITTPEIVAYLNDLVASMKKNEKHTLQIVGHTDTQGDAKSNYDLGMNRARQIKALIVKKGIAEDRINSMSRGEEDPIADNETEKGRQENRRTELIINK